jgi:drug/metabolite transporter (DMT)-like permease
MLNIILAIFTGVLILLIFKLFTRFNINTLFAIVVNYIAASLTGLFFLDSPLNLLATPLPMWYLWSIPLGSLFFAVFYLISQTAQRISVSTASVANKMSVVIPVLFSLLFMNDQLTALKFVGIILALVAVFLTSRKKNGSEKVKELFWLPILVFLGSGIIDTSINATKFYFFETKNDAALFTIFTFIAAFASGAVTVSYHWVMNKGILNSSFHLKNIIAGIALGIPNYLSIYFIFRSLETAVFSPAQLFPLLNLSNVILTAIMAYLIFKEKLSRNNIAGILLAVVAILLIAT